MSTNRETLPNPRVIENSLREILIPTLEKIAADANRRIELKAAVYCGEDLIAELPRIAVGNEEDSEMCGLMRIRFRDAFGGRTLMFAEAIFDREQAVSKCSGFSVKADLRENVAKKTAFTMRYSVWNWTGWI